MTPQRTTDPRRTQGPARTVVRRAPGKLFVAGEYAVVDPGNPAILTAVDRYIEVTVTGTGEPAGPGANAVVVSTDLGSRNVPWRWHGDRLVVCGAEGGRDAGKGLTHVASAVETVGRLLTERGLPVPAMDLSVTSALHEEGRKYGLGSSGAVTVATVSAVAAFGGLDLTAEERYRLALLATARHEPKGSGGDLAASAWGGWIAYRAPDRAFVLDLARRVGVDRTLRAPWPDHEVRRLPPPKGLALEVGWTGAPVSTAALVGDLHRRDWRGSASHRGFVAATHDCVNAAITALENGDGQGLKDQIRRARGALARLDDEVGLGIFTPELTRLCDIAEEAGGAAKPSGAGGGDCGIALLDAEAHRDISQVRQRWAAAGVLPLPIRPALEGIEE